MSWCWENPMPSGEAIYALGGTGADDVWAVTDTMVLHGVSGQWVDTMDGIFLGGAFYTAGPANVWLAVGYRPDAASPASADALLGYAPPSIWHWDGQAWSLAYSFDFVVNQDLRMTGIWGTSRRDIWATAYGYHGGALIHFDGAAWSLVADPSLQGLAFERVWGSAPDDVWTVSSPPAGLQHFDGKSWSAIALEPDDHFTAVASGSGAHDVWVGESNGVAHLDGDRWTSYSLGRQVTELVVLTPGDVWALAMSADYPPRCTAVHWDGSQWMAASVSAEQDASDCYQTAVGWPRGGLVAGGMPGRLDVLTCSGQFQSMVGRATSADLAAIWGTSNHDLWAVGKHGTVLHESEPPGWAPDPVPTSADLTAIWGSGASDVWAVGAGGTALHWDGWRWTQWPTGIAADLSAISGSGPTNIWAISGWSPGQIIRFDGASWSVVKAASADTYHDVAVIAPDDVWITASSGFLHWTGSGFELVPSPGPGDATPSGIKAYARDDIWADSLLRWVFHYDGVAWSVLTPGLEYHSGHMTGYGPYIGKIAGDAGGPPYFLMSGENVINGNIARVDSSGAVTPMPKLYTGTPYNGLFVLGNEVWLVGDGGAIEHGYLPVE